MTTKTPCLALVLLLAGCSRAGTTDLGDFEVLWDEKSGGLEVFWAGRSVLDVTELAVGSGSADITFQAGSYLFEDVEATFTPIATLNSRNHRSEGFLLFDLLGASGETLGALHISPVGDGALSIEFDAQGERNRVRMTARCGADEPFLGGGAHAMDVDHAGEAFPLWVAEPGIGKSDSDEYPDTWYLTGTKHATSYPDPFVLRPDAFMGMQVNTVARVDADFCANGSTWSLTAWDRELWVNVLAAGTALEIVEKRVQAMGGVKAPPDWAFAPWNDAVMGRDRVLEVAETLRAAGAPSSVIWTEDWKGGKDNGFGYHLLPEWEVDEELYPDVTAIDAELEALGFKWFAYFSPFISPESSVWDEAEPLAVRHPETDEAYLFLSATLHEASTLDLTSRDAWDWTQEKMNAALDAGFDGWMADYAEWLPPDAVLEDGDALDDHNSWPLRWMALNTEVMEGRDATFFARSGWTGATAVTPIVWAGDQRTSFDPDDGYPTVVAMGLGMAVSGVSLYGHDVAGYQSIGNPPSDKELWFRWCTLGAFSPIMRTHHGAFAEDNWQFDTDAETLAHYARYAAEHMRLYPYLRGLSALSEKTGRPVLLHPAMLYDSHPWDAVDTWMLGSAMLVAPVLEQGATQRSVTLPDETDWYDWWTGAPAQSGTVSAAVDEIPVFVPRGALIPTFTIIPDTLADATAEGVTDLADADTARTLYIFGGGEGRTFTEADGTRYTASGSATGSAETTETLDSGTVSVGGVSVEIDGDIARTYTIVVYP